MREDEQEKIQKFEVPARTLNSQFFHKASECEKNTARTFIACARAMEARN
jgi:hypothetical protein